MRRTGYASLTSAGWIAVWCVAAVLPQDGVGRSSGIVGGREASVVLTERVRYKVLC